MKTDHLSLFHLWLTGVVQLVKEKDLKWTPFIGLEPWCWPMARVSQFSSNDLSPARKPGLYVADRF